MILSRPRLPVGPPQTPNAASLPKPSRPRYSLTVRREQVLKAAALYWRVKRRFPTYRELSQAIGGVALATLAGHLEALVWLGYLDRPADRKTYGLTDAGMALAFGRSCPCCGKPFSEVE